MDKIRRFFQCLKSAQDEKFSWFLENERLLVEELVASFHGRYKLPIPCFTADELFKATEKFSHLLRCIDMDRFIFEGTLKERPVLVITCHSSCSSPADERLRKDLIHNIVITSQMSHINNVLKLFGCCLEFKYPAMVYENGGTKLVFDVLKSLIDREGFSWRNRLKVARDIANVILHLHTDFPKPIIFKVLTPSKVLIDQAGAARLVDFSYSIYLPPGESKVVDSVRGSHEYLEPEYALSGYVTQKTDVYSLGLLMLLLVTGGKLVLANEEKGSTFLIDYVEKYLERDQLNHIVDPCILKEESSNARRPEMHDFVYLALRCTRLEEDDRPEMIHVAKELRQIEKKCSRL